MFKKKFIFKLISLVLACLTVLSIVVYAIDNSGVSLEVAEQKTVDVVLARSKTGVDVTNFNEDLYTKLEEKGITRDRVNIMALEQELANMQSNFTWQQWISSKIGSINLTNNGSVVDMKGNTKYAGQNAIYLIPEDNSDNELIFNYNINFGDSFEEAGILFGIEKVDEGTPYLRGYLFTFNSTDTDAFRNRPQASLYKVTQLLLNDNTHNNKNITRTKINDFNIVRSGSLSVKIDNAKITITGGGLSDKYSYNLNGEYFGNGFGFYAMHYSHGCNNIGEFRLTNIKLKKTVIQDFKELLNEPKWTDANEKVMVNVSDVSTADLAEDAAANIVVAKLLSDDVHYIGWGNNVNEAEMRALISKNNKGKFINNSDYEQCIEETAEYIKTILGDPVTNDYVVVGDSIAMNVTPAGIESNTKESAYPQGSWKVDHDAEYFANSEGQYYKTGIYVDELAKSFPKVGKYTISYKDTVVKELYVHRRPVAEFAFKLNGNNVVINSKAYDLDYPVNSKTSSTMDVSNGSGIVEEEWSYRLVEDSNWTMGKLTTINNTGVYLVRMRAKDEQGAWSDYVTKMVTKVPTNPIAKFEITNKECSIYNELNVVDYSYDPASLALTEYEYTLVDSSNRELYTGSTPALNYRQYGTGDYTLKLKVKNSAELESEVYSQKFKITGDVTAPEVVATPLNKRSINNKINVKLDFIDTESGFKNYKYGITRGEEQTVTKWSELIYSSTDSIEITEKDVDNYIHIIAEDNAGNVSEERIVGPYRIEESVFEVEVHMTDASNPNVSLLGGEFALVHPKEDTPDERIVISGKTTGDGACTIKGLAMGSGTYEYILYEKTAPVGYDDMGLVLLDVTFNEDGLITNAQGKYNDNYRVVGYEDSKVIVEISSLRENEEEKETFDLHLTVVDKADNTKKLSNATYKIVERADNGEILQVPNQTTGSTGELKIENTFAGKGEVIFYIQQTDLDGNYIPDTKEKAIVFERNPDTGWIKYIVWKSANDVKVEVDNVAGVIDLTIEAQKKQSDNRLTVNVYDDADNDTKLSNVNVRLEEVTTGRTQTLQTGAQGSVQFDMLPLGTGKFLYKVYLDGLSSMYTAPIDTTLEIKYDANGDIETIEEKNSQNCTNVGTDIQTTASEKNIVAKVDLPVKRDITTSAGVYTLIYEVLDTSDNTIKVDGSKYSVNIMDNGSSISTTNKETTANGTFTMDIQVKDKIGIIVTPEKQKPGYILETSPRMFEITAVGGQYQIQQSGNTTATATIDNTKREITITDTSTKKINGSGSVANVNIYFGKKDINNNLLGNVVFDIKELTTNKSVPATTDASGSAISDDFPIPGPGKYEFEITEASTVSGYDNSGVYIKLELVYEILNDQMQCTSHMITKGEKYVTYKNFVQYEKPDTFQLDVFFDILNLFEDNTNDGDINKYKIDLTNIDRITNDKFSGGSYRVFLEYENGTSKDMNEIIVDNGIEIPGWAIYGVTTIKLVEVSTPLGYVANPLVNEIKVTKNDLGEIQVVSKTDKVKETITRNIDNGYIDNILEIGIVRDRDVVPFALKLKTNNKDSLALSLEDIEYEVNVNGSFLGNYKTDPNGIIDIPQVYAIGEIELTLREITVPTGYKLNPTMNKVVINRDEGDLEFSYLSEKSNLPATNIAFDYEQQLVEIQIYKEQEFNIKITNVDKTDPTKLLVGSEFKVQSNYIRHFTKNEVTDRNGIANVTYGTVTNTEVLYTISQVQGAPGYNAGDGRPFQLKVIFDKSGRVASAVILDQNGVAPGWVSLDIPSSVTGQARDVYFAEQSEISLTITNSNTYSFELVKLDERGRTSGGTPLYITGAEFDITITNNGVTTPYSKQVTSNGYIRIDDLYGNGETTITYTETKAVAGYKYERRTGTIVFDKSEETNMLTLDPTQTTVDPTRVTVDNRNQKISVEVINESNLRMGIKTIDAISKKAVIGARYEISDDVGNSDEQNSDISGELIAALGKVSHSRNVIYKIVNTKAAKGYPGLIDDIEVEVYFNDYGNVTSYRILSGEDRVKRVELAQTNSAISSNFNDNIINLEITNGEQDEYKIRVIAENENKANIKIPGITYDLKGYNKDGTQAWEQLGKVTNKSGVAEVTNVDIQPGFKLTVQEALNVDGYCLDDTIREITFSVGLSDSGKKLIDYETADPRVIVQVDNVNNVIEIRVSNEPRDINVVFNKKDFTDKSIFLADAGFDIVDQETNETYRLVVDDNGLGSANLPIKPDGSCRYSVVETDAPIGYAKSTNMEFEVTYADNKVTGASVTSTNGLIKFNEYKDKYVEFDVYDVDKDTALGVYAVVLERTDSATGDPVVGAKTRIEATNPLTTTLSKEEDTDSDGRVTLAKAIKEAGITAIKISEITPATGYIWYSKDIVVDIERNSENDTIKATAKNGISSSEISIDTVNKIIYIKPKSTLIDKYELTKPLNLSAFKLEIASVYPETQQPIAAEFSVDIYPASDNTTTNTWGGNPGYSYSNMVTERRYQTGGYHDHWTVGAPWVTNYTELGTVTIGSMYGDQKICIDITPVSIAKGYELIGDVQHVIVNRDPVTGEYTIVQEGERTVTTFPQRQNLGYGGTGGGWTIANDESKIVIQMPAVPVLDFGIKKLDYLDDTNTMKDVEFRVTSNMDNASEAVISTTNDKGMVHLLTKDVKANSTIQYTIQETSYKAGFRKIDDIVIEVEYDNKGGIKRYTKISGQDNFAFKYPYLMYYPSSGTPYYEFKRDIDLYVFNTDAFEVEITDEDEDFAGLGVEGAKFNITVTDSQGNQKVYNGESKNELAIRADKRKMDEINAKNSKAATATTIITYDQYGDPQLKPVPPTPPVDEEGVTDSYGKLRFLDMLGSGNLTLHYKQTEVPLGYDEQQVIEGDIEIYKDPVTYRVEILNYTGPISHIECDEETGLIKFTVKNQKAFKLIVEKVDINNTSMTLPDAKFELKSQVVEREGQAVEEDIVAHTDITTDASGSVTVNFGRPEPNVKVAYSLLEKEAPAGYNKIGAVRILVTFDHSGSVYKVQNSLSTRAKVEKINVGTARVQISNGTMNQNANGDNLLGYNFKIETTDSAVPGLALDGVTYTVDIYKNNILVDTKDITTDSSTAYGATIAKGLAEWNNLIQDGDVKIEFYEKSVPAGMKIDPTKHTVNINVAYNQADDYALSKDLVPDIQYDYANSTEPFNNVDIINQDRDIIIKLEKTRSVELNIQLLADPNGPVFAIPTKTYRVTTVEEKNVPVDLSIYFPKFDADTIESTIANDMVISSVNYEDVTNMYDAVTLDAGSPLPGKTVVYIVDEKDTDGSYFNVVKVGIKYDDNGFIEDYFLLSDVDNVEFDPKTSFIGENFFNLNITVDSSSVTGTIGNDFELKINKINERNANNKISGADFRIVVTKENAAVSVGSAGITNGIVFDEVRTTVGGVIDIPNIKLDETMVVRITEMKAPDGYLLNNDTYELKVKKRSDGKFKLVDNSANLQGYAKVDENNFIAEVSIPDKIDGIVLAVANKDIETKTIYASGAEFEIIDVTTYDGSTYTPDMKLEANGIERFTISGQYANIRFPKKTQGTHTFKLRQLVQANGFEYDGTEITFNVEYDADGKVINALCSSGGKISKIENVFEDYIEMIVYNKQQLLPNGPYLLNIYKVNENDKYVLLPGAQFDIEIQNELGITAPLALQGTTDGNGMIPLGPINGAGRIKMKFIETVSPKNYLLNLKDLTLDITREENTGVFTLNDAKNIDVELFSATNTINVYIADKQDDNMFTLVVSKVDDKNQKLTSDITTFKISDTNGFSNIYETNNNGKVILSDFKFPEDDGTYSYFIKEVASPKGFKKIDTEMELQITYSTSADGTRKISKAVVAAGDEHMEVKRSNESYVEVIVKNEPSGLVIEKVDSEDEQLRIIGTEFKITNEATQEELTRTTNNDGIIDIKLEEGTYTITETNATRGFIQNTTDVRVKVEKDQTEKLSYTILDGSDIAKLVDNDGVYSLKIKNVQEEMTVNPYRVEILKKDADDRDIRIEGAELRLNITNSNGAAAVTKTALTDADGMFYINKLYGTGSVELELLEISAPATRLINADTKTVSLTRDDVTGEFIIDNKENLEVRVDNNNFVIYIEFTDEYEEGYYSLVLQKTDMQGNPIEQEGTMFELRKEGTTEKHKVYSKPNGKLIITGLKVPFMEMNETYLLNEIIAPNEYMANTETLKVKLQFRDNNGLIKLVAADVDNKKYLDVPNGASNTYVLITVKDEAETNARFEVEKVNETDEELKLPNVKFEITEENNGITTELTTGKDGIGNVILQDVTTENIYHIKEIADDNGFETCIEIIAKVNYDEVNEKAVVELLQGEGTARVEEVNGVTRLIVKNRPQGIPVIGGYSLEVVKCFRDDIEIVKEDSILRLEIENSIGAKKQVKTARTDANGSIKTTNINGCGDIAITMEEIQEPADYILETDIRRVELNRNQTTGEIIVTGVDNISTDDVVVDSANKSIKIYYKDTLVDGKYNFVVQKIDQNGNRVRSNKVKFEITDMDINIPKEYTSDLNGKVIFERQDMPTTSGVKQYKIKEIAQPNGYIRENSEILVTIEFDDQTGTMKIVNAQSDNQTVANVSNTDQYVCVNFVNARNGDLIRLDSNVYVVDDLFIDRVSPNTTIKQFVANLDYDGDLYVYDKKGNQLDITDDVNLVGTEFKVRVELGLDFIEKTVVVVGDYNGDGIITISDVSAANKYFLEAIPETDLRTRICDVTGDGKITISDVSKLNRFYLEAIPKLI